MALFNNNGIRDLDEMIGIILDIKTLHALCVTNKYMNNLCNDDYFWTRKFEYHNLPKPKFKLTSSCHYIVIYKNTCKIMKYIDHVLKTEDIRISCNELNLFHNYVDEDTLEKAYIKMAKKRCRFFFKCSNGLRYLRFWRNVNIIYKT